MWRRGRDVPVPRSHQPASWRSFAVRDGNLITGRQNFSGLETAHAVIRVLGE
jgi:putative intracellular protease/amidase